MSPRVDSDPHAGITAGFYYKAGAQTTPNFREISQVSLRNQSMYLHRSGPLVENGLDRPENRYGGCGFANFPAFPYLPKGWMEPEFHSEDFLFFLSGWWW